jgi:predicted nuclease of predicted toxin-antitoxin system
MVWKALEQPTAVDLRELKKQFAGKARFLVDESMGERVAEIVRERGFNAKYAAECGLIGHSDEDVFATAWADKRVIFTHDSDFMDDRRFPSHRNPGIVLIHPGAEGNDNERLLECLFKTLVIAGDSGKWFLHRKLEFTSNEQLKIRSNLKGKSTEARYLWTDRGNVAMEWVDE